VTPTSSLISQDPDITEQILVRLIFHLGRTMGACRSATQALLNGADLDTELREELLAEMDLQLRDLQRVLNNVAQFKALERQAVELRTSPIWPSAWFRHQLSDWREVDGERVLAWQVEIPDDLPRLVVDPVLLGDLMENLLANAVRYAPRGSRIRVKANRERGGVRLDVANPVAKGQSLTSDRIFDALYPGVERGRFPNGLGLGLHVARRLAQAHRGSLEVAVPSDPGELMTFSLWLPGPS